MPDSPPLLGVVAYICADYYSPNSASVTSLFTEAVEQQVHDTTMYSIGEQTAVRREDRIVNAYLAIQCCSKQPRGYPARTKSPGAFGVFLSRVEYQS
jgi:hypothetical protein